MQQMQWVWYQSLLKHKEVVNVAQLDLENIFRKIPTALRKFVADSDSGNKKPTVLPGVMSEDASNLIWCIVTGMTGEVICCVGILIVCSKSMIFLGVFVFAIVLSRARANCGGGCHHDLSTRLSTLLILKGSWKYHQTGGVRPNIWPLYKTTW
jgi:hypothetical protein